MAKKIDELVRNLASGMSRRKAFMHFLFGTGAMMFGAKESEAHFPGNAICAEFCYHYGAQEGWDSFADCVSASSHCPPGECAIMTNGEETICVPVG